MAETVIGLFDKHEEAQKVIQALVNEGFPREDISIVTSDSNAEYTTDLGASALKDTAAGVGTGALVGSLAGLVLGLSALAIPGVGPIIAAGPIIALLTGAGVGAVTGGLIGALTGIGVPEKDATYYTEAIRRGGTLVTVKAAHDQIERAASIMNRFGAVDIERRVGEWAQRGWNPVQPTEEKSTVIKQPAIYGVVRVYRHITELPVEAVQRDSDFTRYDRDFRHHFETRYASLGRKYEHYEAAYQYGHRLGTDERSRAGDWSALEPQAQNEWEARGLGTWEEFKDAIRYAWDKVRGRRAA